MAGQRVFTVMLVEDHVVVREGIRSILEFEDDIEVVAEVGSLDEALSRDADPDVIVADLALADVRGPLVIRRLIERFPRAGVLVLSGSAEPDEITSTLSSGARGFLQKGVRSAELVKAVRAVAGGGSYVQPELGHALLSGSYGGSQIALSPREREILRLLASGHTSAEVASALYLAPRTVEGVRAMLLRKLGVKTRADLVKAAKDLGLFEPNPG